MVSTQEPERTLQALHIWAGVRHSPFRPTDALVATDDRLPRDKLQRLADNHFGAIDRSGVDEVDAHIDGFRTPRCTASSSVLPAGSPSRLKPPQPRPATLTFKPVFPKVVYSIAHRSSEFATTSRDQLLSHDEMQVALGPSHKSTWFRMLRCTVGVRTGCAPWKGGAFQWV